MSEELSISRSDAVVSEEHLQLIKEEIAILSSVGEMTFEEAEKALAEASAAA